MQDLYNLSAEQSILGAVLIDSNVILEGNQVNLSARDFYMTAHQIIYSAMNKIFAENTEVDLVTLANELKNIGKMDQIGGMAYISSLMTAVPTSSNAIYYMKIVKELSMKRNVSTMMRYTDENLKALPQSELLKFVESLKTTILESGNVEDWYIEAAEIPMELETPGTIATGFDFIDLVTGGGLNYGTLTILTGEPSSGKSTIINQIIANAISSGHPAFLYSGELTYQMMMEWFVKTVANIEDIRRCKNTFGEYLKVTKEA
ncbi:MAG: DnaB-like helicase N-terminal domain-containing protein, partial [Intestinibacter sp.]